MTSTENTIILSVTHYNNLKAQAVAYKKALERVMEMSENK